MLMRAEPPNEEIEDADDLGTSVTFLLRMKTTRPMRRADFTRV